MRKTLIAILMALALVVVPAAGVLADTTADVTVTATPGFISITVDINTYNFGAILENTTPSTTTTYFTIDNTSTVVTDNTIGVTTATWSSTGVAWTHSDTCTPGANTAGLKANKGSTWGNGDVIVKFTSPDIIADNQGATTDWSFGLKLWAPTSFSDYVQKSIIVRITATGAA